MSTLHLKNKELRKQLLSAIQSIDAIKAENIDTLVVANKQALKIYTTLSADNTYRILVEKMPAGAVMVNKAGSILYCNRLL